MSDNEGWPSKIIPFVRPANAGHAAKRAPDAFPRFRKESLRPATSSGPPPAATPPR
jgi:hypothetical protein